MADRLDPFEEFEFKPLTEGLGFHKKAEKIKADIKSTLASTPANISKASPSQAQARSTETPRAATQSISDLMASLPPSLDFLDDKKDLSREVSRPQIFQPLAREEYRSPITTGPTTTATLPTPGTKAGGLYQRDRSAVVQAPTRTRTQTSVEAIEGLVPVAANFSSGLIDAMVVAGISTILLVCIITITHINLIAMLTNASTDRSTQLNLGFLFLAVLQMYMLVARSFFGASLGEWAFDLQLGTDEQHSKLYYPFLAMWRMLFVTFTCLLPLPLFSFAIGRDLGRYVSGLQLYRRV